MLGFEANGDKVKSASFAPMLNNVNGTQWGYDLINFDSSRLYALPSYFMQLMLRDAAGDFALSSTLSTPTGGGAGGVTMATAAMQGNDILVKVASYSANATALDIKLDGFADTSDADGKLQVLTSAAGPDASNTLTDPEFVVPVQSSISTSNSFKLQIPAWSVSVLRITTS